jgi:hypothetical protein
MSNSAGQPDFDPEWETLLQQLRTQPKAQPRPFFYARVQARLASQTQPMGPWLPAWARRPAYVALLGMLVLAVSGDGAPLRPAIADTHLQEYQPAQPASTAPR